MFSLLCAAVINKDLLRSTTSRGSVTITTGLQKILKDDKILWRCENSLIARITVIKCIFHTLAETRFGERLTVNQTNGDLTIKNVTPTDTGVYELQLYNMATGESRCRKYTVAILGE